MEGSVSPGMETKAVVAAVVWRNLNRIKEEHFMNYRGEEGEMFTR